MELFPPQALGVAQAARRASVESARKILQECGLGMPGMAHLYLLVITITSRLVLAEQARQRLASALRCKHIIGDIHV